MFSICRIHPSQYCGVIPSRVSFDRLACRRERSVVPRNTTTDPAAISIFRMRASSCATTSSPNRWLPGTISVTPLVSVKSSIAQIADTPRARPGGALGKMRRRLLEHLRGLTRMDVDCNVRRQEIRGLQQLVKDREHLRVDDQIDHGRRLRHTRTAVANANPQSRCGQRGTVDMRRKLSSDPIGVPLARRDRESQQTIGADLFDDQRRPRAHRGRPGSIWRATKKAATRRCGLRWCLAS